MVMSTLHACWCVQQIQHAETETIVRDRTRASSRSQSQMNATAKSVHFLVTSCRSFRRPFDVWQKTRSVFGSTSECGLFRCIERCEPFHRFLLLGEIRLPITIIISNQDLQSSTTSNSSDRDSGDENPRNNQTRRSAETPLTSRPGSAHEQSPGPENPQTTKKKMTLKNHLS